MKILFSLLLTFSINTLLFSQINCNDFDVDDFVLNGSAFLSGEDEVTLTLAQNNQVGTLWSNQTILFTQDFYIESELFFGNNNGGADGIAFVIQPLSSNAGSLGGGIGYAGITPSLAIEFDTWFNSGSDPLTNDHIAIIKNGQAWSINAHSEFIPPIDVGNIEDGQFHSAIIEYTASTQKLKLIFDGIELFDVTIDLSTIFPNTNSVFWGFTSATGGANNIHKVKINNYCVTFTNSCIGTSGNQLINPSFEIPEQPNIGNNFLTWPINGWNGFGAPPNIVKTNGDPSTGGPNNASDGVHYLDIVGQSSDFYQEFDFQCDAQVSFSGYFSVRDNNPSTGRIDLLRVNNDNTTTLVASSNQLNMPPTANVWYLTSGSAVIPPGIYRFNISMGQHSNFDNACFSFDYPVVNTGFYGPICESGGSITLTGVPTDSFGVWSGSGVVDNGNGTASFNPSGLGGTIVTVTYAHYNASGFGCTQTTDITVNPNIEPEFTQVEPICDGDPLNALPTTSNNGITGTWSPDLNNTATTTYTFTPDTGLCATTATMTIEVNLNIEPEFTQVAPICDGDPLNALPTTSNNGITGTWSPDLNNTATTTYTFTPDTGLCATTATMTIEVNSNIEPEFTQVAPICDGDPLNALPTTSNNGMTGTWSPDLNNTATTTYTFTPDTGLCATTATMTIEVYSLPNKPTGNSEQFFCAINNPRLSDIILNISNINWYLSPSGGSPILNNPFLTDGMLLYAGGLDPITFCESLDRLQVIVRLENPQLPLLEPTLRYCIDSNATISTIITNGITMNWYFDFDGGNSIPPNYILQNGDIIYGAAVSENTFCESDSRIRVEVEFIDPYLDYYNLITIDNNQLNEKLTIEGIEKFKTNSLEIYNRYGKLVWKSINYDNKNNVFKGMANVSGVISRENYLPTGTYFFVLTYPNDCKKTELKGFLQIDNKL